MLPLYTATLLLAIWLALGARWAAEDVVDEGQLGGPVTPPIARPGRRPTKHNRWINIIEWGSVKAAGAPADTYTHNHPSLAMRQGGLNSRKLLRA